MSELSDNLMVVPPYAAPMHIPEPGAKIVDQNFLRELICKVRDKRCDLSLRKLDNNGYVIELVVRNSVNQQYDIAALGHCDNSALANKYVSTLYYLIKDYAKQANSESV